MLFTYDPSEVAVIVGGQIMEQFADGTFVNVVRNEDSATFAPSSQGGGTRTKSSNRSGRMTITLQQTSPSNALLTAFVLALENSNGGIFPVILKDNSGRDLHTAATAWVVKPADSGYANELENREWIIESDEFVMGSLGQAAPVSV